MKVLLSPTKSLDYDKEVSVPFETQAPFIENAEYLADKLKKFSRKKLGDLMHLSTSLTDLNYERYQAWESPKELGKKSRPAASVFTGEVFKAFDLETLSSEEMTKAQQVIRILSGLYGILRPLDLMAPYRLEMGTKWQVTPKKKNLYSYWGTSLADFLNEEMDKDEVLINLASNEYFKAIDKKVIKPRIITPVFKELKGDKYKVVMIYAKHARGAMARDIVQQDYQTVEDLKGYNIDGYSYNEQLSSENEWVFVR
jgi:cytoplasmic iron level regulating protein YaaA (DUF328/UPF0246 family)